MCSARKGGLRGDSDMVCGVFNSLSVRERGYRCWAKCQSISMKLRYTKDEIVDSGSIDRRPARHLSPGDRQNESPDESHSTSVRGQDENELLYCDHRGRICLTGTSYKDRLIHKRTETETKDINRKRSQKVNPSSRHDRTCRNSCIIRYFVRPAVKLRTASRSSFPRSL